VHENAALICDGADIAWCGTRGDEPRGRTASVVDDGDCARGVVTDALLGVLYPHYLSPVPSAAILQLQAPPELALPLRVTAGLAVESEPVRGEACRFRTAWPLTLWPVEIETVRLSGLPLAAPANPLAAGAVAVLRMLPRSGTGQVMTSYVNWITGPSRSADIEQSLTIGVHGPSEMHCVILDNGREKMLADPIFRDAMTCIRCGACSNACPPFMAVSGHQFGYIYNGPIGLVLTPFHHGLDKADLPNTLCVQCNACQEICPVDIPLPRQILEHRRAGRKSLRKRAVLGVWERPKLADRLMRAAAPFSALAPGTPRLARSPFRDQVQTSGVDGEPLTIFASCLVDRMWPRAGVALERIASAAGFKVGFPKEQWCCGLIAANAGEFKAGAALSEQTTVALRDSKGLIVTPSASCFGAYTMDAADWGAVGDESVRSRFRDSTRFALQLLETNPNLVDSGRMSLKIAYHDSCQTLRQLGLKSEPRRVLELAGYEVVDIPDIANCCGFGGSFSLEWPRVADRLAEWKLDAIAKTGCAVVASDNPGGLLNEAVNMSDKFLQKGQIVVSQRHVRPTAATPLMQKARTVFSPLTS